MVNTNISILGKCGWRTLTWILQVYHINEIQVDYIAITEKKGSGPQDTFCTQKWSLAENKKQDFLGSGGPGILNGKNFGA